VGQTLRRIGLLGGSFDPVHAAHRALADTALQQLQLDEVKWIVAGQPWQKATLRTPAEHRAAMVELAVADDPRHRVCRLEVERQGASYTVESVRHLQDTEGPAEWFLIIGQDQYANFPTWRDWTELAQRVTLAVAARGDQAVMAPEALRHLPHRVVRLQMPQSTLSSTEVRRRLRAGEPASALVPDVLTSAVAAYVDHHHLYRD
jgi:nicotinate-nucleotide adenylyltransferase